MFKGKTIVFTLITNNFLQNIKSEVDATRILRKISINASANTSG